MNSPTVHQIKVTLEGIEPPVWRRFQVPSDIRLRTLHRVLQAIMGWIDSHLCQFLAHGATYGEPGLIEGRPVRSARRTALSEIAPAAGIAFIYEYDLGDNWRHVLLVERILPFDGDGEYPVCLVGESACPPEDCGGVSVYEDLLECGSHHR